MHVAPHVREAAGKAAFGHGQKHGGLPQSHEGEKGHMAVFGQGEKLGVGEGSGRRREQRTSEQVADGESLGH